VAVEDEAVEEDVFVEEELEEAFVVVVVVDKDCEVEKPPVVVLEPPPIGVTLDGTSPPMMVVIGACSM